MQSYWRAHSDKPESVVVPMPWDPPETHAPAVTADELADLRAYLDAHSAIRDT